MAGKQDKKHQMTTRRIGQTTTRESSSILRSGGESSGPVQRNCLRENCDAPKMISTISPFINQKKIPSYVYDPRILPKPVFESGQRTIFKITGTDALLTGYNAEKDDENPVYKIIPTRHTHVVNYIVIDDEGIILKKISEDDPETKRQLLESQKRSAEQLLTKLLMSGRNANAAKRIRK